MRVTQCHLYGLVSEEGLHAAQVYSRLDQPRCAGVAQDIEQAYLWFHVAAAQGYKVAFENKGLIEEALEKQENGTERLESLKKRAREFFQQYVMPFGRPPTSHQSFKAPQTPQGASH